MPVLPGKQALEPRFLRRLRAAVGAGRAHGRDLARVRLLVTADLAQQPVGRGIAGGRLVGAVDLGVLGRLAGRQHGAEGGQPYLQAGPGRKLDGGRIRHRHPHLLEARLDPLPVTALSLGQAA